MYNEKGFRLYTNVIRPLVFEILTTTSPTLQSLTMIFADMFFYKGDHNEDFLPLLPTSMPSLVELTVLGLLTVDNFPTSCKAE